MTCTCNPARTFTWVDEECPTHGREAQEQREDEEYSDAGLTDRAEEAS